MSPSDAGWAVAPPAQAASSEPQRGGGWWPFLWSELRVLFRRWRTWAMLAALVAIPVLIAVAVKLTSSRPSSGRGPAFLDSITHNGLFVGITALVVSLPLFLPLTIGVVAGDTIAGEASLGTLRYLLAAPVGRVRLLVVKYIGTAVFCVAATLAVVIGGTLIGAILFPIGPVTLLSGATVSVGESFLRLLLIAGYVTVSLLGLSAIGLFFSTLTTVPVGAMATTITVSVASEILDNLPQVSAIHPWLFSHYWLSFGDLLRDPVSWQSFGNNALLQLGYIAVFGALAYGRFLTKDILS